MGFRFLPALLVVALLIPPFARAADQAVPVGERKFQIAAPAHPATPIDAKVSEAPPVELQSKSEDHRDLAHGIGWLLRKIGLVPKERKRRVFHCKIPSDYGTKTPETLEMNPPQGFVPPPPAVETLVEKPAADLCLADPKKFYEDQAGWMYSESVLKPQLDAQ